ncbi:MAG TPA: extracellular solute-binding protein [Chloroflexota bacterium]|nr:extracellular solute-binding protein [Chloroflexota bacterium]
MNQTDVPRTPTTRRRVVLTGLAGGALAPAIAACGAAGANTPQAAKQPITLRFMTQGANPPNEWDSLLAYSRQAPHVTVALDVAGGGEAFTEKGLSLASAGSPPHVSWCSTRFGIPFLYANLLSDIQEHVKRAKLDVKDIAKPVYEETLIRGKLAQLTTDVGYAMLAYNKTALAQAGRPDPWTLYQNKQWTWDRFVSETQAISQAGGGAGNGAYGVVVSTWDGEFFTVVRSNGGDVLDKDQRKLTLDQPAAIEALEAWAALINRQQVAPPVGAAGQVFATGKVPMEFFAQARIGRTRTSAAQAGYQWDVVATPAHKTPVPTMFTNGLQLWKGKDEREAFDFIAYSMSTDVLLERGKVTGRVPSRLNLLEQFAKTLDIPAQDPKSFVKLYPELAKTGRGLPSTANFTVWRDIVQKEILDPVLAGKSGVREAVQRATPLVNAELAKNPA